MCPASTAEVMMNAMIKVAQDKIDAGDATEAIKTITTIIDSIVNNEAHVQKTFGQNLVYLYCSRAKLYFETGAAGVNTAPGDGAAPVDNMELARQDVHQAEAALDVHFPGLDATEKENVRANINAVISPDEKQRADGLAAVRQMKTAVPLSDGTATRSAGAGQAQSGQAGTIGAYALIFLIGLIAWGIIAGLFVVGFATTKTSSGVPWILMIPALILLYIAVDLATKGWDWLADRGIYGWRLKVMLIIMLAMTIVGMLPIVYWTGKGAVRWYYRRR